MQCKEICNLDPSTNAATSGLEFFLRILPKVICKLNCAVARNSCWFTMATLSDGIDSQMMLCTTIRESKMGQLGTLSNFYHQRAGACSFVALVHSMFDSQSLLVYYRSVSITVWPFSGMNDWPRWLLLVMKSRYVNSQPE